jgi:hypothetical protein
MKRGTDMAIKRGVRRGGGGGALAARCHSCMSAHHASAAPASSMELPQVAAAGGVQRLNQEHGWLL